MRKLAICFAVLSALGLAQQTGSIRGTITDATHSAVPNAKITVTDVDRGVDFSTVSDTAGRYVFPTLPAARYTLGVEAAGFQKATQPAFSVEVQQQATVNVELSVGSVSTSVEVQATAPLLNTTSASLGQVVENRLVVTLPNSGRDPLALIGLTAGIIATGASSTNPTAVSGVNFVSSGVRNSSAEVMMDGGPLTGIEQNGGITDVKYKPTTDVVDEFKIQTNAFSAEFGNSGGTVINMVSKSGTNQFHGVGYYFIQDNAMNANNWFSNKNNSPLANSRRQNYGGTIGGPVTLGKLYHGKNRTFFFFDYDRIQANSATTSLASVPTAQQLSGDFSDTRLSNGTVVPLYDPYSLTTSNGTTLRNPIPGNLIPASRQNPITLAFDKYFPAPNQVGDPFTRNNNWFGQGSTPSHGNKLDVKIDHNISEKQRFSARYGVNWTYSGVANLVGNQSYNGNPGTERDQNFTMDYTRTQSPTTIIALRAGVLRVKSIRDPLSTGFDATTLGLPAYMTSGTNTHVFPLFSAQYRSMGSGGYAIIHRYEDVYQYMGSVTKIVSGHTIKAGAEFRKLHENYYQPNLPGGGFTFSRNQTAQNPLISSSTQGDGLASALLGFGSSGAVSIDYATAQSAGYVATYLNDDWRLTRKLTINLGLRWDADIPRTDRFNRLNWLDYNAPAPIADNPQVKAVFPNLKGLMRFADSSNRTPYNGDWNNVQPRFGFAYALDNKTSIRAAYGLFYTVSRHTIKGEVGTAYGFTDSSIQWSLDSSITQFATFANPWPTGLTYPPGKNPSGFLGLGAGTPEPFDINPQYQMWNFSIQREIRGLGVLEVNYTGTKGTHLYFGSGSDVVGAPNNLNPIYWGLGRTALNGLVPNPFYGVITNPVAVNFNQPTIQLNRLLRTFPEYSSAGGYRAEPNIGNSIYHAVQLKYEKRFSHGLSMVAHYTFSKMISDSDVAGSDVNWLAGSSTVEDLYNLRNERSVSTFDRTHRAVITGDYQLPFGRSRTFGKNMNRILDGAVGGWEVAPIITLQTGAPLGISQSASTLWNTSQRPNIIGDPSMPGPVSSKLNNYLNINAFSNAAPDTLGSAPRFLTAYRGPHLINQDVTLMKNFPIKESKYFQVRLEAYHWTNSPQWANPNTSYAIGSSSFGQITSAGGNRTLQVAAKFYY
jgi:hypothetical protein